MKAFLKDNFTKNEIKDVIVAMRDMFGIDQGESSTWGNAVFYQRDMDRWDSIEPDVQYRIRMNNLDDDDDEYDVMLFSQVDTGSEGAPVEDDCPSWFEGRGSEYYFDDFTANQNGHAKLIGYMLPHYSLRDDDLTGLVGKHVVIMKDSEVVECCTL